MIIRLPRVTEVKDSNDHEVQITARIETQAAKKGSPSQLWFRFPQSARSLLSPDASSESDPFAVALLLLAMQNREPMILEGSISKKLLTGLAEYQRIYHEWYPDRFKIIEITAPSVREDPHQPSQGRAAAFSGGVDSFFTLLELSRSTPPSHVIFMAGFDMPLRLEASISQLTQSYAQLMHEKKIGFIHGSTNVREFVNSIDWTNAHGQALAASALFFRRQWDTFYVPSSYTGASYPKWGTHPRLDPLLSTEEMQFIHHGAEADRYLKLRTIAQAPESYKNLRVCWIQDIGLANCGRCEKCVRTMIALDLLGVLHLYPTFSKSPLTSGSVRGLKLRTYQSRLFARELWLQALKNGKLRRFTDLSFALLRREIFYRGLRPFGKKWESLGP